LGKHMDKRLLNLFLNSCSDNRKPVLSEVEGSKTCTELSRRIENPKWVGIFVIALTFAFGGVVAHAQQPKKVQRIGFLSSGTLGSFVAFREGLRELGYVEGKNIVIEYPKAEGNFTRAPARAAELLRLKVDVIVTSGATDTRAAKEATTTIPIVFLQDPDPIGNGFVTSLARPGGNITGLSSLGADLSGKRLELLKEVLPKLSRVAVLGNSANAGNGIQLRERTRRRGIRNAASIPRHIKRQGYRDCVPRG
jgi:ABC-type uncharacterized transport system substrate-binding protein